MDSWLEASDGASEIFEGRIAPQEYESADIQHKIQAVMDRRNGGFCGV